jgi:hypothetical protein
MGSLSDSASSLLASAAACSTVVDSTGSRFAFAHRSSVGNALSQYVALTAGSTTYSHNTFFGFTALGFVLTFVCGDSTAVEKERQRLY